jgi:hypothetical protein
MINKKSKFLILFTITLILISCKPQTIEQQVEELMETEDINESNELTKSLADSLNPKVVVLISGFKSHPWVSDIMNDLFFHYSRLFEKGSDKKKIIDCVIQIPSERALKFLGKNSGDMSYGYYIISSLNKLPKESQKEVIFEGLKISSNVNQNNLINKLNFLGDEATLEFYSQYKKMSYSSLETKIFQDLNRENINSDITWEALMTGFRLDFSDEDKYLKLMQVVNTYDSNILNSLVSEWLQNTDNKSLKRAIIELGAINFYGNKLGDDYKAEEILAKLGDASFTVLMQKMKSSNQAVRFSAADALVKMSNYHPEAVSKLTDVFDTQSTILIAKNYPFYIRMGLSGTEDLLIKTLINHFSKNMCLDYLNCANSYIEEKARNIAASHGYSVFSQQGSFNGPKWGGGN